MCDTIQGLLDAAPKLNVLVLRRFSSSVDGPPLIGGARLVHLSISFVSFVGFESTESFAGRLLFPNLLGLDLTGRAGAVVRYFCETTKSSRALRWIRFDLGDHEFFGENETMLVQALVACDKLADLSIRCAMRRQEEGERFYKAFGTPVRAKWLCPSLTTMRFPDLRLKDKDAKWMVRICQARRTAALESQIECNRKLPAQSCSRRSR